MKGITHRFIPRRDSSRNLIKIVLYLYEHPFASLKQICSYDGNKNYKITKNYILYLLEHKIIFQVPYWQGIVYYVNNDDQITKTLSIYHTTKHRVSLSLNKIAHQYPQLKEKFTQNKIINFTKITRTNIPKQSFDISGLDASCTTIIKYLNLIILATRILILEEKSHKSKLHLAKRHARICEMWLDLESFLDKYFGKTTHEAEFMEMAKSSELEHQQKLYWKYFSHITHSKTTFSEYAELLRQIKLGFKQEYAYSKGFSLQCLSKILKNFTDSSGHLNIRYLAEMIKIETADSFKPHNDETEDLFLIDLFAEELSRLRISFYKDDELEAEKIRKIIKNIYPQMQIIK